MHRIMTVIMALIFALFALTGFGLPLFVQAPQDLWPQWLALAAAFPLPQGTEIIHVEPPTGPPGNLVVLSLGGEGKTVALMPLVPVSRLGQERRSASRAEVSAGSVPVLPLCDVVLPWIALPLDGVFPDGPGYPLTRPVTLRLDTTDPLLRQWYDSLPERTLSSTDARLVWIAAVGDIMPARGVDHALLAAGGIARVFGDTLSVLRGNDLLLGNLESSAAAGGVAQNKSYTFRFRGDAVEKLKEAGFSYLSLANNHTFDFGTGGFLQTLAALARSGVATSGAGADREEARRAAVMRAGSQEVRILSFGAFPVDRTGFDGRVSEQAGTARPGILWLDDHGLADASAAFAASATGAPAFTVAFVHGGEEWRTTPTAGQMRLYRDLVSRGAQLVLGAHPHVLEGMEAVDGSLIAYSLGNFLFPGMDGTPGGEDSVILRVGVFDGKIRAVQAVPVRLRGGTVSLAPAGHAWEDLMARTRALAGASAATE